MWTSGGRRDQIRLTSPNGRCAVFINIQHRALHTPLQHESLEPNRSMSPRSDAFEVPVKNGEMPRVLRNTPPPVLQLNSTSHSSALEGEKLACFSLLLQHRLSWPFTHPTVAWLSASVLVPSRRRSNRGSALPSSLPQLFPQISAMLVRFSSHKHE
ncbi:hypothetical protein CC80DRAFT_100025 [Byssothecium circinans]|uniref:Uncharacterized protein n=1 Tax=Byssothecium circinans TaxID=147558 RepID=A0A6A5UF18_9PLEO|nr:hypothetical protein CC80DRAFT_100025 [Byssothecium circinans]